MRDAGDQSDRVVEAIGEHYVLTDDQKERLEEELSGCGVEVSTRVPAASTRPSARTAGPQSFA